MISEELINFFRNKSIVLLGESAHGILEQNLFRIKLIKALNEQLNFNVLYLESVINRELWPRTHFESSYELLSELVHPVYHTKEMLEFLDYVQNSNISLQGFEIANNQLAKYREIRDRNGDFSSRSYRDITMFENFRAQLEEKHMNQKVIIWAHNAHVTKKTGPAAFRKTALGEFIHQAYPEESVTLGQYCGTGTFEHMPDQTVTLTPSPNSLEQYICENVASEEIILNLNVSPFDSQLDSYSSGLVKETLILKDFYDGLVLHKEGTKPIRVSSHALDTL